LAFEYSRKPFYFLEQRTTNVKVHNLSSHSLSPTEQLVLSKNLKFIPTPKPAQLETLRSSVDNLVRNIRIRSYFGDDNDNDEEVEVKIKFHIPNPEWQPPISQEPEVEAFIDQLLINTNNYILYHSNDIYKSKLNLSPTEFKSLKDLINNKSIVIKPSDKNAGITVMNRQDYIQETEKHLLNTKNYKELSEEESQSLNDDMKQIMSQIFQYPNNRKWFKLISKFILSKYGTSQFGNFYVLPKVHKTPMSTRPILASHSALLQNFSIFLAFCLQPFVESSFTYIKNSRDFVTSLRSISLDLKKEYWITSGDVDAMYPNIDLKLAMDICKHFYTISIQAQNAFSLNQFIRLVNLMLYFNILTFNGKHYKQINGLPMGSSASPPVAILVLDKMENDHLHSEFFSQVLLWKRYVDDIFFISDSLEITNKLKNKYNSMHPSIKVNWKTAKVLEFLDVTISVENNQITTWPYQKPMSIFQYIPFQSFHKYDQKINWIKAELERFCFLSSTYHKFLITSNLFFDRLRRRGYPSNLVYNIFEKFKKKHWKNGKKIQIEKTSKMVEKSKFFLKLEFNPTWVNFKIQNILPQIVPKGWKFQISWSNAPNMGKRLIKAKLPKVECPNEEIGNSGGHAAPHTPPALGTT
jgi:hypothetical protein